MSLAAAFYPIFKPLLFSLDAEVAHEWTLRLLRVFHGCRLVGREAVDDPAGVLGMTLKNRLGLAAGMDKGARAVDAWAALGFGFVEVGTLTPRPQPGNPKPRLFRLPEHLALINRMGFNNPGIDVAVARLKRRRSGVAVGVNIGKNFDTPNERAVDDYVYGLRACYAVADYVAVNISSPNTKGLRDLQAEEPIRRLIGTLQLEQARLTGECGRRVPMLVKIAPDLTEDAVGMLSRVFTEMGVDGVIATNTTITRDAVKGHALAEEAGGLSGAPVLEVSNQVLKQLRAQLPAGTALMGVGGICCGADARAKIQAGADLVQVYSGLVFQGPALIRQVTEAIRS
jgi:dihydroorotate dehydrogenase